MAPTAHNSLPPGYRIDPRIGAVYPTNQTQADHLAVIRGLGTREAAFLNHLGIYYFGQIAAWTDQNVAAIADELGMSASAIFRHGWVNQAHVLSAPHGELDLSSARDEAISVTRQSKPASGSRTVSVLAGALLLGCLLVSWMNREPHLPMSGVLAAEVTSLRVPADARLLNTHVSTGDEVFTGETLLTLEKLELHELIAEQEHHVDLLGRELQKARAQATLELRWRSRELDHRLSETRARVSLLERMREPAKVLAQEQKLTTQIQTVSLPRVVEHITPAESLRDELNPPLIFISARPQTNKPPKSASLPVTTMTVIQGRPKLPSKPEKKKEEEPLPETEKIEPAQLLQLEMELEKVSTRLELLEKLRNELPSQVRLVAGLEALQTQYDNATGRLKHMQNLSRESAVISPGYGTIGQMNYHEGDRMARGQIMLKILHTNRRFVIMQVPADTMPQIELGTHLEVTFEGHDACHGKVANVPMVADKAVARGQTTTTVRLEPVGRGWPEVPIGSRVSVALP